MTSVSEVEADADLERKPEDLLKEIYRPMHHDVGQTLLMRDTIKALALSSCISIQISRAGEAQSKRVIRLTRWLIFLTIALLVVAGVETVGPFFSN